MWCDVGLYTGGLVWWRCSRCGFVHRVRGVKSGGGVGSVHRCRVRAAHGRVEPRGAPSTLVPTVRRCRGDRRTGYRSVLCRLPKAARRVRECTVFIQELSSSTWTSVRGREILCFGVGVTLGLLRASVYLSYMISVGFKTTPR